MAFIAFGNPEAFRDWQYQEYQNSLNDIELEYCVDCGHYVECDVEVLNRGYIHDICVCEHCIEKEMDMEGCAQSEAIETLKRAYI